MILIILINYSLLSGMGYAEAVGRGEIPSAAVSPPVYVPACVMFFASLTCRYVLLVSGLNLGSPHSNEFIETMVDYITGQLDGAKVGTSYFEIDHF